jgi:class 3 adenylate cyclase/tetratricopeptide (TPR) repeat protein
MSSDTQVEVKRFVPRWLRQRLRLGWDESTARIEPMRAAVMFADIAGFSALTRKFTSEGDAGLEQLTVAVSDYFGRLFDRVTLAGGDIENTYGDGFLAFWPAEGRGVAGAVRSAQHCAVDLTTNFDHFRIGADVEFRLRAIVLEGEVFAVKAGGVDDHWLFFLAGDCLSEVTDLLSHADLGGVAPSQSVQQALATSDGEELAVYQAKSTEFGTTALPLSNAEMMPFLPGFLRRSDGRLTEGWLAEFRLLSVLVVRIPGLRCREIGDLEIIQTVIEKVQRIVGLYEGAVLRVSMNDKGPFILCAFGLPENTHEDDPKRAEAAARALYTELTAAGFAARCAVTEAISYCGMVGRGAHHSYTMMGEAINRVAKLVAMTDQPEVLVDFRTEAAQRNSRIGDRETTARRLIGREAELRWLDGCIGELLAEIAHPAILITGEAGVGKSALLREVVRRARGVAVHSATANPLVGSTTPYAVWRQIFGRLFSGDGAAGSLQLVEALRARLMRQGEDASLLGLVSAALPLPGGDADGGWLNPADRARLTRAMLVALLKDRLSSEPALLWLEDAHWMDAASWALAAELVRQVPKALLVLSLRPLDDITQRLAGVPCKRRSLEPVAKEENRLILVQAVGCQQVTADVIDLVHTRSAGNPLFTIQLGLALLESKVLAIDNGRLRFGAHAHMLTNSALSDTVQRVIVSRVDRLPASVQQTLKAASVIGDTFDLATVQALVPSEHVADHLGRLADFGLVRRLPTERALSYRFNHGVTREVMYRQMSFSQRRRLHEMAANALELTEVMPSDAVLGYHWLNAGMPDRAMPYWERTGYAAYSAGAFAEAAASFNQALACLNGLPAGPVGALRAARLYRHSGDANLQIGNIALSRAHLVEALVALGRKWPGGKLSTTIALATEMGSQLLTELAPQYLGRRSVIRETDREAAQVYESLGQVLGHTSELNLMGLATLAALNISQRCGSNQIYSRACGLFALVLLLMPLPGAARRYFSHSIAARPGKSEPHDWLMTTEYLALYDITIADLERAESTLQEMIDVAYGASNRRRSLDAMSLLSITLMCKGDLERSAQMLGKFEMELLNEKDPQVLCWVHLERAELALMRGDAESALQQVDGCWDLLQPLGRNERLWGEGLRALALWRSRRNAEALAAASQALSLLRIPNEIAFYAQGGVFAAAEVFVEALGAMNSKIGDGTIFADTRSMMRRLRRFGIRLPICRPRTLMLLGRYQKALNHKRKAISLLGRAREAAILQHRPYEEALATVQLAATNRKFVAKADEALQSLCAMGAGRLLDHLPAVQSSHLH